MISTSRRLAIAASLFLATTPAAAAFPGQQGPRNLDFEDGKANRPPPGWHLERQGCDVVAVKRPDGKGLCLNVSRPTNLERVSANISQSVDARPYRGKTILFSGEVQSTGRHGRARLWLRVDRPADQQGFFDDMSDRPIGSRKWKRYRIVGKVHEDATGIGFGMMFRGRDGSAFLDNVKLEIIPDLAPLKIEGPRPLSGRGLENVIAFSRLLGYVRYFHPSDQARGVDWERFAVEGIRKVEAMRGAKELADKLQELFQPIAPTVRVTLDRPAPVPAVLHTKPKDARLVAWEHLGINPTETPSVYCSEITDGSTGPLSRLPGEKRPINLPDPKQPFRRQLPGGVRCMVPLALYRDEQGTLPHAPVPTSNNDLQPRLTPEDRATRLAAVALGWNVFQHFYPYFDVVDVEWKKVLRTTLQEAATDKDAAEFLFTLRRMVAKLQDGHGRVLHKVDDRSGALPIGFAWADGVLVVDRVRDGATRDVAVGDVVVKIDGHRIDEFIEELSSQLPAATPQHRRSRVLKELTVGRPGKKITFELERGEDCNSVELEYTAGAPVSERRPGRIAEIKPGIWYVDISRITNKDFTDALDDLKLAKGIVFDFRGYPNNIDTRITFFPCISKESLRSAQWNVPVPRRPDQEQMEYQPKAQWLLQPKQPYLSARKVFLIDGRAISYAESCMGIVEHHKLGAIVGEATAGTNGSVLPFRLPGGYRVRWTGMKVLKQDGSRHHGVGIQPTVPVTRTVAGIRAGKDEFLEKALEILADGQ